jgi:hypothetical protein
MYTIDRMPVILSRLMHATPLVFLFTVSILDVFPGAYGKSKLPGILFFYAFNCQYLT